MSPNKSLLIVTAPGGSTSRQGVDGTAGWYQNPQGTVREMIPAEMSAIRRNFHFYRDIKLKELYPQMRLRGREKVSGRAAYVVEATPSDGSPEKIYFDTQSGLLIRNDLILETQQGRRTIWVYFDDYKEVDGVQLPFTIRQIDPDSEQLIELTEIKHNVPIDDAKFNKPGA